MTGLEIILLIIGVMVFAASFIFSSKIDGKEEANAELTNKQKEDMKNQILAVFDEQMEAFQEKTEISLDKISNEKIMEMNEYSETILGEINRNHNEVMFLYDMLNEKKKEVNNTVRDMMAAKKELADTTAATVTTEEEKNSDDVGFMASEAMMKAEKKTTKPRATRTKREKVLDQLDAVAEAVADDVDADEAAQIPTKTRKKPTAAKTAATRARTAVKKETARETNKDITVFETGNNNEKILELNAQGKSNVEIAKELGLGIGEVKLVIDLFRGGK